MLDQKLILNVAAGIALVMVLYWAYNKYSTPAVKPATV